MFNFTICNGPRQVIGVEVTAINKEQGAFWVKGNQYNADISQWVEVPIALRVGPFALPKLDKIKVGDTILVKMTYDEGNNQVGTAEEIGIKGETIITYSAKNNKKYVTFAKVNRIQTYQKKDNTGGKLSLQLSFKNPINAKDGTRLGEEYRKTNDQGQEIVSYWINSSLFFNSQFESAYTAEKAETEIGQGDTIICVTTEKPNKNDPSKMNYSCNKFLIVEKAAVQPAVSANPFPEIPGVASPVATEGQFLNQAPTPQPTAQVPTMPTAPAPQPQLTPAPQPQFAPQPQMTQVPTQAPAMAPTAQVPTMAPTQVPTQATTPTAPVAPVAPTAPTMAAPQMNGVPANFAAQLPFN